MDIQDWAEKLVKEVYRKWKSMVYRYDFSGHGFRVFYSPVYFSPDLMIIGYNPASDERPFCEESDGHIPFAHEYFQHESRLARRTRYLFESIERDEWLEKSVKLNLIFFGSETESQWEALDPDVRIELELFCFRKVHDIIETLKPRYIFTEGLNVFNLLLDSVLMGCDKPEVKFGVGGRKIYGRSKYGHTHIIGLAHLTKDRISYPDWNSLKKLLKSDLKDPEEKPYLH